jgi:hypothetical protein
VVGALGGAAIVAGGVGTEGTNGTTFDAPPNTFAGSGRSDEWPASAFMTSAGGDGAMTAGSAGAAGAVRLFPRELCRRSGRR